MVSENTLHRKGPYHQIYHSRIKAALAACHAVSSISHGGEKGRIREVLLRDMFRPLLPSDVGVGTGFIVATNGVQSSQQDIVLYDRATLPPALIDHETGLFPIESVLRTIEIKSRLTHQELVLSHNAAKALASFPLHDKRGMPTNEGPRPGPCIFALDSDLSPQGRSELDRYLEVRGADATAMSAICVIGRGYWWLTSDGYREWPERAELAEVIGFMIGMLNNLPAECEARRVARPPIGAYLSDFGRDFEKEIVALINLDTKIKEQLATGIASREQALSLQSQFNEQLARTEKVLDQYKGKELRQLRQMVQQTVEPVSRALADLVHSLVGKGR